MTKKRLTLWIIIGALAVIAAIQVMSRMSARPIDAAAARSKGSPQAKMQIVEFIDFQCPACAAGSKLLKRYTDRHPDGIRLQVKYFPLAMHRHSMPAAVYSECAGRQGRFWEFHELLIAQQPQWSPLLSADSAFQNIAREAGLDPAKLNACVTSESAMQTVTADRDLGKSLAVQSTPTYFINNKMVVGTKSLQDELDVFFPGENPGGENAGGANGK